MLPGGDPHRPPLGDIVVQDGRILRIDPPTALDIAPFLPAEAPEAVQSMVRGAPADAAAQLGFVEAQLRRLIPTAAFPVSRQGFPWSWPV